MARIRMILAAATISLLASACLVLGNPWAIGSSERPYYCSPTDTAVNDGHGHAMPGMPPSPFMLAYTTPKGPLSAADCQSVATDTQAARAFAEQLSTVADAEAAGWRQAAVWSEGQGVHYVDPSRLTGPFDPQKPNWLMFDGTDPSSKITGMMFLTNTGSTTPPAGFAGANDHWHQHGPLCTDPSPGAYPFIIGEHLDTAACSAIGGTNIVYSTVWMVHVWLPIYDNWIPTDIFNKTHPSLP